MDDVELHYAHLSTAEKLARIATIALESLMDDRTWAARERMPEIARLATEAGLGSELDHFHCRVELEKWQDKVHMLAAALDERSEALRRSNQAMAIKIEAQTARIGMLEHNNEVLLRAAQGISRAEVADAERRAMEVLTRSAPSRRAQAGRRIDPNL